MCRYNDGTNSRHDRKRSRDRSGSCARNSADLSTYEGRQTVCSILKKEIDALHVLVNNAGTNKLIPTLSVSSGRLEANPLVSLQCGQQSD
jgi:short-subunit dehydrogenase